MKLRHVSERPLRPKSSGVLLEPQKETRPFGIDIDGLVARNKKEFLTGMRELNHSIEEAYQPSRANIRMVIDRDDLDLYLSNLTNLAILDPAEYVKAKSSDKVPSTYYLSKVTSVISGGDLVSLRAPAQLFPEHRTNLITCLSEYIQIFFTNLAKPDLSKDRLPYMIELGVTLMYLLPDRREEIQSKLQSIVKMAFESLPRAHPLKVLYQLTDCMIVDPDLGPKIREIVLSEILPQLDLDEGSPNILFSILSNLKILDADEVKIDDKGQLKLMKRPGLLQQSKLPERDLTE